MLPLVDRRRTMLWTFLEVRCDRQEHVLVLYFFSPTCLRSCSEGSKTRGPEKAACDYLRAIQGVGGTDLRPDRTFQEELACSLDFASSFDW